MPSWSKQIKSEAMRSNPILEEYIPFSCRYSKQNFNAVLKQHNTVYLKPERGSRGRGIYRITNLGKKIMVEGSNGYKRSTDRIPFIPNRYIIQENIELIEIDQRKMDIRVITQKDGTWKYQGIVCKLGKKGNVVSNYCMGGSPSLYLETMRNIYTDRESIQYLRKLRYLSLEISKTLSNRFPDIKQLGIDFGIDTKGKIWVIEANTTPGIKMFKQMKNQRMYNRMKKAKDKVTQGRVVIAY